MRKTTDLANTAQTENTSTRDIQKKKSMAGSYIGRRVSIIVIVTIVAIISGILIYRMVTRPTDESTVTTKEVETLNEVKTSNKVDASNDTETANVAETAKEMEVSNEAETAKEMEVSKEAKTTNKVETANETVAAVESNTNTLESSWSRTNVYKTHSGYLDISNQTEEGFDFSIYVCNGGNVGNAQGHATFESETKATGFNTLYDRTASFYFTIKEDKIEVTTDNNAQYLGGLGTFFDGTYIQGEPTYLNANIVKEILGNNLEDIKNLLGEDYKTLTHVMEEGTEYETDLTYEGFISGLGEGVDLWIKEEGSMYCLIYTAYSDNTYLFYTNDADYQTKVPEEFGELRSNDIKFIYVDTKH